MGGADFQVPYAPLALDRRYPRPEASTPAHDVGPPVPGPRIKGPYPIDTYGALSYGPGYPTNSPGGNSPYYGAPGGPLHENNSPCVPGNGRPYVAGNGQPYNRPYPTHNGRPYPRMDGRTDGASSGGPSSPYYLNQHRVFVPPAQRPPPQHQLQRTSPHPPPPNAHYPLQKYSPQYASPLRPGSDNSAAYDQQGLPLYDPRFHGYRQYAGNAPPAWDLTPHYQNAYAQQTALSQPPAGAPHALSATMIVPGNGGPPGGQSASGGVRTCDQMINSVDYTCREQPAPSAVQQDASHAFGVAPRRVLTLPDGGPGAMAPARKERDLKVRTKSMTSSAPSSPAQRTPSLALSHALSFSLKSCSFNQLAKLSSSSKEGNGNDCRDRLSSLTSSRLAIAPLEKSLVYPAILSSVARVFKEYMALTINMKDGLEYHDSFTGKAAVDMICDIISTKDRNLALLMCRALDAQKLFHDVTYNHRSRDSSNEVYAFSRVFSDAQFYADEIGTSLQREPSQQLVSYAPYPTSSHPGTIGSTGDDSVGSCNNLQKMGHEQVLADQTGVNGVFTILTDCYLSTCTRSRLCYLIACPRRLEQQARLNLKPRGGLRKAVSRLSLHDNEATRTLWHETVDQLVLDKLDKSDTMRQELIYELIYTERDYVKDLEFMTDFYIMPLCNPANNIIPERERDAFIRTVFGGVSDLLQLAKSLSEALTARQQVQKPVVECVGDVMLRFIGSFDPFIKYLGNKVFASFEHERQQLVNFKYARFLETIEKKPELRKQDFLLYFIKGNQRPARYQLLLSGILTNTKPESPDYENLVRAKEEIEKVLVRINLETGEATDRHKIMVLHRVLGRQTLEERFNFRLSYNHRIIYQVTLSRKRDNEKIDMYLFEHAILLVKHKIQNKREVHKVFESPIYLPLLFVNSGYDTPTFKLILAHREDGSLVLDAGLKARADVALSLQKLQLNFFGLSANPVHVLLFADDLTHQHQILLQILQQQRQLIEKNDIFSLAKYETRRFSGNNRINCAVPCNGGKKLLYGTDSGVWVSTVRSISMNSSEKICSDPIMVISKPYVTQMEVLVEYSKVLLISDKVLYEFDLTCTDSLDHVKNTRSGKIILTHVTGLKTGVCDGRLLVCAIKSGSKSISIVEPTNPFDTKSRNRKRPEVREIAFTSEPVSISFLKTKLCIGCTKGFEILSLDAGRKEPILDRADPLLDFATQRETVCPLLIHRLDKNFLLSYSEFSFLINRNGWRTKHDWRIFWEGTPQNIALFYPYLLAFEPGFIEIRDLESANLIRALVGENIRFLHSNEHEALYACEENGYDIVVSIDFLNLKPKAAKEVAASS